jgi:uncharacterized membrane protein
VLSKRDFGFWHLLRTVGVRPLLWPEGTAALIVGSLLSWVMLAGVSKTTRLDAAGDYLVMAGVLLGIVFATFAVVTSLLSDSYLLFLRDSDGGVLPFLAPFVVGVAIQCVALAAAMGYQVAAKWSESLEPWAFTIATILFVYALLDVISLSKIVIAHAATRAEYLAVRRKSNDPAVSSGSDHSKATSGDEPVDANTPNAVSNE